MSTTSVFYAFATPGINVASNCWLSEENLQML